MRSVRGRSHFGRSVYTWERPTAGILGSDLLTIRLGPVSNEVVMQRRRSPPHTFEENIVAEKAKLEAKMAKLKPGPQMEALRKKIRQLETASQMSGWLSSPGLRTST
jgi:hypothetical protein